MRDRKALREGEVSNSRYFVKFPFVVFIFISSLLFSETVIADDQLMDLLLGPVHEVTQSQKQVAQQQGSRKKVSMPSTQSGRLQVTGAQKKKVVRKAEPQLEQVKSHGSVSHAQSYPSGTIGAYQPLAGGNLLYFRKIKRCNSGDVPRIDGKLITDYAEVTYSLSQAGGPGPHGCSTSSGQSDYKKSTYVIDRRGNKTYHTLAFYDLMVEVYDRPTGMWKWKDVMWSGRLIFQKTHGRYIRIKPKNQTIHYQTSLPPMVDGYLSKHVALIKSLTMTNQDYWPYVFKRTHIYPSYREMQNKLVVFGNRKYTGETVFDGDSKLHPYVLDPVGNVTCNVDGMKINLDQEHIPYSIIFTNNLNFDLSEDDADTERATVIVDDEGKVKALSCDLSGITYARSNEPWSVVFLRHKVKVLGRTKVKTSAYRLPGHVLGVAKNRAGAAVARKWLESNKDSGITTIRNWGRPGRQQIRMGNTMIEYVFEGTYGKAKAYLTDGTRTTLLLNRYTDYNHPRTGGYPIEDEFHWVAWQDGNVIAVRNRAFLNLVRH